MAQAAAEQLLASSSAYPPPSMMALLALLHIEPSLIHYSPDDNAFEQHCALIYIHMTSWLRNRDGLCRGVVDAFMGTKC